MTKASNKFGAFLFIPAKETSLDRGNNLVVHLILNGDLIINVLFQHE
jgi:hypothetical protein